MQELSQRKRARLLTDIAFATTLAAVASFSIAAAQAQTGTPPQSNSPLDRKDDKKPEPTTTGETRAAPAPQLPVDQTRPPISGKPLDQPDKELHSAPPEKIEGK